MKKLFKKISNVNTFVENHNCYFSTFKEWKYSRKPTFVDWFIFSIVFITVSFVLILKPKYFNNNEATIWIATILILIGFIMLFYSFCKFINAHIYKELGSLFGVLFISISTIIFSDIISNLGCKIIILLFTIIIFIAFLRKLIDYFKSLFNKPKEEKSKTKTQNSIIFIAQLLGLLFTALQILKIFKII